MTRALFSSWFLGLVIFLSGAQERLPAAVTLVSPPTAEVSGTSATVRWTTSSECGTRMTYGTAPEAKDHKASDVGVTTEHAITLEGLQPGTTYYFSVATAKYTLGSGSFTTSGKGSKAAAAAPKKETPAPTPAPAPAVTKAKSAPPLSRMWGNPGSLPDHFARHGADFGASSPEEYARMAWEFLQRAKAEGLPAKYDESDETIRVWDAKTGTFAAYHRDGRAKTFFKPGGHGYFERQPGRLIKLKDWNF